MVEEFTNYLNSDVLYWPMFKADYPQMTLGGYLMRQRRLHILSYLLTDSEQVELKQIVTQFGDINIDRKALLMKKAIEELHTRVNQWREHLQEYWDSEIVEEQYFATDVEVRTIITDLIFGLGIDLYQLGKNLLYQIDSLDDELRVNWQEGDFTWPVEWILAYGKGDCWWHYGMPDVREKSTC